MASCMGKCVADNMMLVQMCKSQQQGKVEIILAWEFHTATTQDPMSVQLASTVATNMLIVARLMRATRVHAEMDFWVMAGVALILMSATWVPTIVIRWQSAKMYLDRSSAPAQLDTRATETFVQWKTSVISDFTLAIQMQLAPTRMRDMALRVTVCLDFSAMV